MASDRVAFVFGASSRFTVRPHIQGVSLGEPGELDEPGLQDILTYPWPRGLAQ